MIPAAAGAPGTRLSFGKWTRRGWMGAGYLVARQLDPSSASPISSAASARFDVTTQLERSKQTVDEGPVTATPRSTGSGVAWGVIGCVTALLLIVIAHNARRGAVAARIKNAAVHGAPRPVRPLFGWTHWLGFLQVSTAISMVLIIVVFVMLWRRYPKHPVLLMAIVVHLAGLAGPDHELGPVRGLQPAAVALA